jgi:hypothetical protein
MNPEPSKWYFKTNIYILAFLCVGPLALPLVWMNPRYKRPKKVFITVITLLVCYAAFVVLAKSTESIYNYYNQMLQLSK